MPQFVEMFGLFFGFIGAMMLALNETILNRFKHDGLKDAISTHFVWMAMHEEVSRDYAAFHRARANPGKIQTDYRVKLMAAVKDRIAQENKDTNNNGFRFKVYLQSEFSGKTGKKTDQRHAILDAMFDPSNSTLAWHHFIGQDSNFISLLLNQTPFHYVYKLGVILICCGFGLQFVSRFL